MTLKIITINTRWIVNNTKRRSLFYFLKKEKFDIICLQETHITNNNVDLWKKQWNGPLYFSEGTAHSKGQLILLRKNPIITKHEIIFQDSRILGVKVCCNDKSRCVFNVYGPNIDDEKGSFFSDINCVIQKECKNDLFLIAGDFNTVANNSLDIISGMPHQASSVQLFNDYQASWDVFDAWRMLHEEERQYTWHKRNPFVARRLDYILCNSSLLDNVGSCEIIAVPGSDHRGVCLDLQLLEEPRGPSYWKFNGYLLLDESYVEVINNVINETIVKFEGCDDRVIWDVKSKLEKLLSLSVRQKPN